MAHDSYSDDLIASILRENTSIAMVGASANTNRELLRDEVFCSARATPSCP